MMQTLGILFLVAGGVAYGYGWKLHSDGDTDNKVAGTGFVLLIVGFGFLVLTER